MTDWRKRPRRSLSRNYERLPPEATPILGEVDRMSAARGRVSPSLMLALVRDFEEHGAEALARARRRRPSLYLKFAAAFLPADPQELLPGAREARLRPLLALTRRREEEET